jgi:hypothetical protein
MSPNWARTGAELIASITTASIPLLNDRMDYSPDSPRHGNYMKIPVLPARRREVAK